MTSSDASLSAWLLPYADDKFIALPIQACHEIIEAPTVLNIPAIAPYGIGVIQWRDKWRPLIDFNSFVTGGAPVHKRENHCLLIAYRTASGVNYGAFSLSQFPHVIHLSDDDICGLPNDDFAWKNIAISCFRYQRHRVPIIDAQLLFTGNATDYAVQNQDET